MAEIDVLMVTETFPPDCGGGGWSTYNLAKALNDTEEVDVDVLAVNQDEVKQEGVEVEQIEVKRFPNELAYYQIYRAIQERRDDYDIIQGQHSLTIPPLGLVDDKPTVGVIRDYWPVCYQTTLRDNWGNNHLECGLKCAVSTIQDFHVFSPYKFSNHYLRKKLTGKVDFLATKSDFVTERLDEGGVKNAETVRDFVPKDFYKSVEPKGEEDIIFFGKLIPNKGPQLLLDAIPEVLNSFPDQEFTIFGLETEFGEKLKQRIVEEDLEEKVNFLGKIPFGEVKQRVKGAKATVHPSLWHEPLSRVCIESMSLGTPVISTPTGGSPEIVKEDQTGLLFEDRDELVESLKKIQEEDRQERYSKNAEKEVKTNYNKGKIVDRWKEKYSKLIE